MWAIYRKISPNKIFGNSTSYLRGTCNIYTYNKTGKTKGFAFKRVLAHVVNKLIKLDGINTTSCELETLHQLEKEPTATLPMNLKGLP